MVNLIKAELHRIKHFEGMLIKTIIVCMISSFISFITLFTNDEISSVREALANSAPLGMVLALCMASSSISGLFPNRMAYYEIMNGTSPHTLILYRIAIYLPILIIFFLIPLSIILFTTTDTDDNTGLLIMLSIIFIMLAVVIICACLLIKSHESCALPAILILPMLIPTNIISALSPFLSWFSVFQCNMLSHEITRTLVIKILISFVVEVTSIYTLTYISYKKKWIK